MSKRMEWPLKTAQKEILKAFDQFVIENKSFLENKKLLVWGASVRGTLLGMILEKKGLIDFLYIDNDERKWGNHINGHSILNPNEVRNQLQNTFILIPVEYPEEICKQLYSWGLKEDSFAVIKSNIEKSYTEEFFRQYGYDRLVIGETFLNETIIDEENPESIKDCLWRTYKKENMKVLAMNCMGMQGFYHMIRLQIMLGYVPQKVWIFVNFETLTEFHHMLSRTQHPDLLKMIAETGQIRDEYFQQYIQQAEERARNYKIEMQYSPQRTFDGKNVDNETIQKEYMKIQILRPLSLETEEMLYFKRILQVLRKYDIAGYVINTPINYQLAKKLYHEEFVEIYEKNRRVLKKLSDDYKCQFWDMGDLLEEGDFVSMVTINDAVCQSGRDKILAYIDRNEEMEDGAEN